MSDKVPPRPPLGTSGERTIIRPNPGGRRPVLPQSESKAPASQSSSNAPSPAPSYEPPQPATERATPYVPPSATENPNPDEWIATKGQPLQQAAPGRVSEIKIDELVAPNENPILRSAGPLLLLLGRLRVALARASFASLMEVVADAIKFFDKDIRSAGISETQANASKYIICATADDIVQNIPTEDRHIWTQYSMLSRFFGERIGGVRFFDELNRVKQDPVLNYDVLELQHTCLALGFQGIHRTSAGGVATLQQIQRDLYETLRRVRPKVYRELSPRWQGQKLAREMSRVLVPWWGVAGFAGLILFGIYFVLLYWLSGGVDSAASALASIHGNDRLSLERKISAPQPVVPPPPPPPSPQPTRITQLQRICAALTAEVAAEKATIEQTANLITVRLGNVIAFASGSAAVLEGFKPIAARVVDTLDKEEGYIKVIGHTDNTPIGRANIRFPSNHELSLERAKSVAVLFKSSLAKPDRLQIDGKGETTPIAGNDSAEGRAKNRRVEIVIPRTDSGPITERTCRR